jgi:[protein-PII] uridylyltransferase
VSLASRAAEVEDVVRAAQHTALENVLPGRHSLIAVGGFGRRELFPYSDIDLLILVDFDVNEPPVREAISRFLQTLWDAKLRPSHSVRTADECAALDPNNLELTMSLMDRRLLCGDESLYRSMDEHFTRFERARATDIGRGLARLVRERHAKFQNTIYHLEPNVKESPGGLRDLHTVRWFERLKSTGREELDEAHEVFTRIRSSLHERAGRDQNILSFDAQEALAERPADLMRDYYRHARSVFRALRNHMENVEERSSSLLQQFRDWRSRLSTSQFTVAHDRVFLRMPPEGLQPFEFVARHQLELAPDAVRRLAGHAPALRWNDWKALLSLPRPARGLRAMQDTGVLAQVLPAWRAIECLVVRDFHHRYTVDEHSLVAIESLEAIEDPRFAGVFEEIEDPALVRFALLLHDVGKGSGDHVPASVWIASSVLENLGAPPSDRDCVLFLIERHLDLSNVMTGRDLGEESTARLVADRVSTVERLKMLTLLTWADISAVHPGAMTPWRREQLWRLYVTAHQELTRELDRYRIHNLAETSRERAEFLEGLPMRYLRTHSGEEIDAHVGLASELTSRIAAIKLEHWEGLHRLTLLTRDRPGLLASVAGTLAAFGMNILKAEAFGNDKGVVIDTFVFADPMRTLELNPGESARLSDMVRRVVEGRQDVETLLRGRPKAPGHRPRLQPRVAFDNQASETSTLIEVVAEDRPGLLYHLARAISVHGANIEVVLIDTEAHRALDVLYVTEQGGKISADVQARLHAALMSACGGELQRAPGAGAA